MAKRRDDDAKRRLLEAWEPPQGSGDPIGCIATTFTFQPDFFEEHCLSRFLRMETDPREDGAAYLIEREEKLAETNVVVLVDRSQAGGSASPRWSVLPVTISGRAQHAKVSVLAWDGWVRVLIGSANLTEVAHRKNQEVCAALDFHASGEIPSDVLRETLDFLRALASLAAGAEGRSGPKARLLALLDRIGSLSQGWAPEYPRVRDAPRVTPMFLAPLDGYREPVLDRLGRLMRERGGPASYAWVLSPFFDPTPSGATYPATTALLAALTDRGNRKVEFAVPGERLPDGRLRLRAPRVLVRGERKRADYVVYPIFEDVERDHRPLHAKSVWLWSDREHVYMAGSSNFTRAGLGLAGSAPNVEANLAFAFPDDTGTVRQMEETIPECGDAVDDLDAVLWEPVPEQEEEGAAALDVLPANFQEALFEPKGEGGLLILRLGERGPAEWQVTLPEGGSVIASRADWEAAGRPGDLVCSWRQLRIPTALRVEWQTEEGQIASAIWPVNVTEPGQLLPPEDLRHLSLDTLVEILVSPGPLHEAVLRTKRRQAGGDGSEGGAPELDPLRRVRTETFLLQRTRRVAKAVEHLVERLSRPVMHVEALRWRLAGPVGPVALAQALEREARSPGEAAFLLVEILLALRRIVIPRVAVGVPAEKVRAEVGAVRVQIEALLQGRLAQDGQVPPPLAAYVARALAEARR
jgi:hypothetical protein